MEIERIFGLLFSGFMCKLYAAAMAVWIAYEAAVFVRHVFATAAKGMNVL